MLLMSRRKTINLTDSKKKKCGSCKRSNSAKPSKNSMIEDKKPIVPPHATSNIPSAPPQTMKNQNDTESEWNFPEPPNTFAGGPGNSNGGGGGTGGDLDFDELARRFDQLKKK
ncbi:hypothetical protein ANCCAN_17026 [Ancylostoma caninum]|uniref:Uncharacterized protein n=1 Tax=Ancylostoma caninum TaxID=29170 RepID=A0A368FY25_ANCCA|nr:hypothetical protein ANCCAN_17026 [Ancylostoma caninum]